MDCPFAVSAPGKVILHGEHSVVHGKKAIACALGSRITVTVHPDKAGDVISFKMPSLAEKTITVSIQRFVEQCQDVGDGKDVNARVQAVSNKECKSFSNVFVSLALSCCLYGYYKVFFEAKKKLPGIGLTVATELPIGAGLGSSAAFNTSVACAFLLVSGDIRPADNCGTNWMQFKDQTALEKIDSLAYEMESIVHATPSGIDNSIATYGRAVSFQNGLIAKMPYMPELRLLIVNTGVARSTKTLVVNVREYKSKFPNIVNPILDAMHNISLEAEGLLQNLYEEMGSSSGLFESYAQLIKTNHCLLSSLGVSHPRLDRICSIASRHGFAAKLTGAGGGGCAFILLPAEQDIEALEQELSSEGFQYWLACLGGPGVMLKPLK